MAEIRELSELSERKKRILKAIIDEYIRTAEPVGSKVLVEHYNLALSAATLRNEMADLEQLGYLTQPHTSSGRIPTHSGYRLYVDELMKQQTLSENEIHLISQSFSKRMHELDKLIAEANRAISEMSNYAAVAVTPKISGDLIKKIDLFSCNRNLFVFVMMSESGLVNDKLIRTALPVSTEDTVSLAELLNKTLVGLSPGDITFRHIAFLEANSGGSKELLSIILEYIRTIISEYTAQDIRVDGASKLLYYPEYRDLDRARPLFDFLDSVNDSSWITKAPKELPPGEGAVDIRIGRENGIDSLNDSSFVVTDISLAGNSKIYLGLLGPTRMDYAKASARLQFFARILGKVIEDMLGGDTKQ